MAGQELQNSHSSKLWFFYGYIVVAAGLCIMAVMYGTQFSFGVFFKPLLTEFDWTRAMTSGAFSLNLVTYGLLGAVMGALNDRLGPRAVLTLCGFLFGLGYLLMSQVSAIWHLYVIYGVTIGTGMSGCWVPLLSTVARWFTARRSMMTGIVLTGTGIGTLIAAPVANRLISIYDWRMSYIILGSGVLVVVVLAAQLLRRDPTEMGQLPYGQNKRVEQGLEFGTEGLSLREAVDTRQFWIFAAVFFCFGFCFYATIIHIVPHSTDLGLSAATGANILATIGALAIVGRLIIGSAADRIGNRRAYIIGFILMAAAYFWLVQARAAWMLYLFAIAFGFAHGGMGPLGSPLTAELFGLRSHGLILGVLGIAFTLGGAFGPFLTGYIFDVSGNYHVAFLLCAIIGIVGLILIALLRPMKAESEQNEVSSNV